MGSLSFNSYMNGYWYYSVYKIDAKIETAEEAVAVAKAQ